MDEWFDNEDFWKDFYPFLFSDSKFEEAYRDLEKIIALVDFKGKTVLDLGCGPGRFSIACAKKGYAVTGVDKSNYLLNIAKDKSKQEQVPIEWIRGDMRTYSNPDTFDLLLNLFTSFGFFESEKDDIKVLERMHNNLKSSGCLIIDTMSKEILAKIFTDTMSTTLDDGTVMIQRPKVVENFSKVANEWILLYGNNTYKKYTFNLRLYSAIELKKMLEQVGFNAIQIYGDLGGVSYDTNARRLVLVARK
jgi:SAM-dependent methyltransferase